MAYFIIAFHVYFAFLLINKKIYDKICHISGDISRTWECYAEMNLSKKHVWAT